MEPMATDNIPPEVQDLIEEMQAARLAQIEALGKEVAKKRDEAVKFRKQSGIETIWEEDDEYYQGVDEANRDSHPWVKSASTTGGISHTPEKKSTRCSSFFNITRQFVDSASARMGDILLPSGDWNFAVKATPVQDDQPLGQLAATPEAANVQDQQQVEAEKRAEKAELKIKDWLTECRYHTEVRKVIEDAARIGTGIIKGPYPEKVTTKKVVKQDDGSFAMTIDTTESPSSKHVDPWDFFPDPACGENIHNGSFVVEQDRLTAKQLKDLKGVKGYLSDQIDKVLDEGPSKKNYSDGRRDASLNTNDCDQFEVWYFTGLVNVSDLSAMNVNMSEKDSQKDLIPASVVLVNETPIKAFINPLDSGEFPYDVIQWQRMTGFWAGIGIARQGRTAQDMLNASARALMDNAGLSSGPQIIIRQGAIVPADQRWEITPRKVWLATEQADVRSVADAFVAINIPMVEAELNNIIQLAYKMMEDSTGIVYLLQGQQGAAPDTVGGMELLHRNASAILRRIARVFDERITEPHITRYYEFLLLHGPDDCKGDMKIEAIGSTALVEREIQAMEAMQLLQMSLNPAFGLDPEKAAEEMLKAKRMNPDKWKMEEQKKQNIPQPIVPAIEVEKIRSADRQKQMELDKDKTIAANTLAKHKVDIDTDRDTVYVQAQAQRDQTTAALRAQELQVKKELAIMEYSAKHGIALDQIKAQLAQTAMKLRTQSLLSANGLKPSPQVVTPPMEPPGKAKDGFAFEQ